MPKALPTTCKLKKAATVIELSDTHSEDLIMPKLNPAVEADESKSHDWDLDSSRADGTGSSSSIEREDNVPVFAKKENKNVLRSKILVFIVLLLATGLVSFFTYYFLSQEEKGNFEAQYLNFQIDIIDGATRQAEAFLGKLLTISNTITAFTHTTGNNSWPNVTIQNFDILTSTAFEEEVGPEFFLFAPIVEKSQKKGWEEYAMQHQRWIKDDLALRKEEDIDPGSINEEIFPYNYDKESAQNVDFSLPLWQMGPVPTSADIVMMDLYTQASFRRMVDDAFLARHILLSEVVDQTFFWEDISVYGTEIDLADDPRSFAIQPVYDSFEDNATLTAFVFAVVPWNTYFVDILPHGIENFVVQVNDTCGSNFAYLLNGPEVEYLGEGFNPDSTYDYLSQTADFAAFTRFEEQSVSNSVKLHCVYKISVHATYEYASSFETTKPVYLTIIVMTVFVFTAMVFVLYDLMVQRRQDKVMKAAQKTTAIVSSLFPKNVQKRILASAFEDDDDKKRSRLSTSGKDKLRTYFDHGVHEESDIPPDSKHGPGFDKPIADFFPDTTIMFADIVGFTAWSSTREPSQVFTLLETIYNQFDRLAKVRKVFKVETVGDCYVAVAGLPDPRKDHAVVMARFARDCLSSLQQMTKELEVTLGPDTADLSMRIGLHSGPVTAGVLRGDRARFQLFGDTMNTASRMESTGFPNKIHVSNEFVHCLEEAGKSRWVSQREDKVFVKGKGYLQTYFLYTQRGDYLNNCDATSSNGDSNPVVAQAEKGKASVVLASNESLSIYDHSAQVGSHGAAKNDGKIERLVEWNVDLLSNLLKEIIASRQSRGVLSDPKKVHMISDEAKNVGRAGNAILEVQEIIKLPAYHGKKEVDPTRIVLDDKVVQQLRKFISHVAHLYQNNPFHNFEHASHVSMSVVKLLSRIIAPDMKELGNNVNAQNLHDHTYGITSDPLTRFAVILSALIHDVDHPGVPNAQLIKENDPMAKQYENKSIAEQNSVDLAWGLLHEPAYKDLCKCIYQTEGELIRFRQLIVNSVMATDIMDKDLKTLRNNKWDKAFKDLDPKESERDRINRKATIVIEHLIQASDVAHTMQHWHIYRKWNARLFEEMHKAYVEGRAEKDPSEFWYNGELGFLDFYVIPLAKKLKECGVFGVSSDEYLQYAMNNRAEWERKGEAVVKELVQKVQSDQNYKAGAVIEEGDVKTLDKLTELDEN
ncbi:adenylate/guanylate cyclase [Nitzschia inconspicua]|uniref:Adenylate/guanylate cyclase n=1 Tax=Nitzschia inconspicua TaxID=303405 RepID=A0A9K3PT46_9STRA|nr:adenylate/guanylate cyclase [Nitzschia inconspicua]